MKTTVKQQTEADLKRISLEVALHQALANNKNLEAKLDQAIADLEQIKLLLNEIVVVAMADSEIDESNWQ